METNKIDSKTQSKYTLWGAWAASRRAQYKIEELAKQGKLFKK